MTDREIDGWMDRYIDR